MILLSSLMATAIAASGPSISHPAGVAHAGGKYTLTNVRAPPPMHADSHHHPTASSRAHLSVAACSAAGPFAPAVRRPS
jgi:hypothetical protein